MVLFWVNLPSFQANSSKKGGLVKTAFVRATSEWEALTHNYSDVQISDTLPFKACFPLKVLSFLYLKCVINTHMFSLCLCCIRWRSVALASPANHMPLAAPRAKTTAVLENSIFDQRKQ